MRYSIKIDNVTAHEWGLNIQLAYLFAWMYEVPSWADKVIINDQVFYFASRHKAIEDLPLLSDKPDTIYRHYKELEKQGLVVLKKIEGRDYVALTAKARHWNVVGKKSDDSEKNPTELGKFSENNSEKNPTDYNTSIYSTTSDKGKASSIEERKNKFKQELEEFLPTYGRDMLNAFYVYWTELDTSGKKMRFEAEKFFEKSKRLATWKKRDIKFQKSNQKPGPVAPDFKFESPLKARKIHN